MLIYPSEFNTNHKVTCSKECSIKWQSVRPNEGKFRAGHLGIKTFLGKKHSEESKIKMSTSRKGVPSKMKGISVKYNDALDKWRDNGGKPWNSGLIGWNAMEKHHNWQGGKSFEPYPLGWTRTFKEQIRRRDEYKCQMCGVSETEHGKKLSVHHIDYNKHNLALKNLISLCNSCHCYTHWNREYWLQYFKSFTEIGVNK